MNENFFGLFGATGVESVRRAQSHDMAYTGRPRHVLQRYLEPLGACFCRNSLSSISSSTMTRSRYIIMKHLRLQHLIYIDFFEFWDLARQGPTSRAMLIPQLRMYVDLWGNGRRSHQGYSNGSSVKNLTQRRTQCFQKLLTKK